MRGFIEIAKPFNEVNLIFEDLNETEGENTERVIREFIKTELKIEDEISSQNVHRLRKIKAVYRELY